MSSVYRTSQDVTAQLVEQRTENPRVTGSIPVLGIFHVKKYGALAQSVEHLTFNQVVGGSNPPCFTKKRELKNSLFCLIKQSKSSQMKDINCKDGSLMVKY